jgi:hypothetical protein
MPLYKNQTNLAGQGKFAPGVTYYAGIRAPVPAAPRIEKGQYSFNIDLSPIADAYVDSQKLEASKYEAEAERNLRIDLANMEDKRYRDLEAIRDAREREMHAEDLELNKQQLEENKWKNRSDRDLKLRELALKKEKEEKSAENRAKYVSETKNKFEREINKIKERLAQHPDNYSMEQAKDDAFNLFDRYSDVYSEYFDPKWGREELDANGLGWKNMIKAQDDKEYNMAKADEDEYQNVKTSVPSLQKMSDGDARALVTTTSKQINTYLDAKRLYENATNEEQRVAARQRMIQSGVGFTKANILNNLYDFATQPHLDTDLTNYNIAYNNLRNKSINQLSASSMDRLTAERFFDTAAYELDIPGWLERNKNFFKESEDVYKNLTTYMITNGKFQYVMDFPILQNMMALGIDPGAVYEKNPDKFVGIYDQVNAVSDLGKNVTYNENTKTWSVEQNGRTFEYTNQEAADIKNEYKIDDTRTALTRDAAIRARNMPKMREDGYATGDNVTQAVKGAYQELLKPGQVKNDADAEIVAGNIEATGFRSIAGQCMKYTDTKEAAVQCVNFSYVPQLLRDTSLRTKAFQVANSTSVLGGEKKIGFKIHDGSQFELGFTDDNTDITNDNYNHLKSLEKDLNSRTNIPVESKIYFLQSINGLQDMQYLPNGYRGTFKTDGNVLQKAMSGVTAADASIAKVNTGEKPNQNLFQGVGDVIDTDSIVEFKDQLPQRVEQDVKKLTFKRVEDPSDNPFNQDNYPLVDNGNETASGVKAMIITQDDVAYIIPTMWDGESHSKEEAVERFATTHKHFGGYESIEAAEVAEKIMHKYHDVAAKRFLSEKQHQEYMKTQPYWKQLIESFGMAEFKETE